MKKLGAFVSIFLISFAFIFGFLYYRVGLKSYISDIVYLLRLKDPSERSIKEKIYFGGGVTASSDGYYDGGIFAGTIYKYLFYWGSHGLKIVRINSSTRFVIFDGCSTIGKKIIKKSYDRISLWSRIVKTGNHVFVVLFADKISPFNLLRSAERITTNLDFDVSNSRFCHDAIYE